MTRRNPDQDSPKKIPKVRIARPNGRASFQLRYLCPTTKKEVRVSVGSRDSRDAERKRKELEAKLCLGIDPKVKPNLQPGSEMPWDDFREQYRTLHLNGLRERSALHAESRLDMAEQVLKPKTLGDVAAAHSLQKLQAKLLAGEVSRRKKPRSPHTVRGYINAILASLNWAFVQGWLDKQPRVSKIKTSKQKAMKGRPITKDEFLSLLKATAGVVGQESTASWEFVLRGLWESALRLEELMHVSWDIPGTIRPIWTEGKFPILEIPASMQKNDTDQSIPLLPWFEKLLFEIPPEKRTGWVFEPFSLRLKEGRKVTYRRPEAEWVGKVIVKIGKAAGIVVEQADPRTGRPIKYASAHDLRRSCGERLRNAGVPPLVITRVMRHSSWETTRKHYAPGDIQQEAEILRSMLT